MLPPSSLVLSPGMGADLSSTARVQRGPSQAARCASTEDHQAPSPPLFREQGDDQAALPLANWRSPSAPAAGLCSLARERPDLCQKYRSNPAAESPIPPGAFRISAAPEPTRRIPQKPGRFRLVSAA